MSINLSSPFKSQSPSKFEYTATNKTVLEMSRFDNSPNYFGKATQPQHRVRSPSPFGTTKDVTPKSSYKLDSYFNKSVSNRRCMSPLVASGKQQM